MSKVHLNYKVKGKIVEAALCGNNSRHYKYGLNTCRPSEFREVPSKDRCAHCEREYLVQRNRVRKMKGLPPVKTPFEGQDIAE